MTLFLRGEGLNRILLPQSGIELVPPAVEAWCFNHWTAKEVPVTPFFEFASLDREEGALNVCFMHLFSYFNQMKMFNVKTHLN